MEPICLTGAQAGGNHCPRCGNAVYMAEKIVGAGQVGLGTTHTYAALEVVTLIIGVA